MPQRAVFMSDIHGNLPALQAVIHSLPVCDAVFVAGDHCVDGPNPAEVWDTLVSLGWTLIMGNGDQELVSPPVGGKEKKLARIAWTRAALGPARLDQLSALPFSVSYGSPATDQVLVVHANPRTIDEHLAPSYDDDRLAPYLRDVEASIVVFGHLHTPYIRPVGRHLLVDVSSVGHPKDHDRRPAYTIITWDGNRRSIEQVRVPYDIDETCDSLLNSGMPGATEQIDALLNASY